MSAQTAVRMEDWNRLQREVGRLRILVITDAESAAKAAQDQKH